MNLKDVYQHFKGLSVCFNNELEKCKQNLAICDFYGTSQQNKMQKELAFFQFTLNEEVNFNKGFLSIIVTQQGENKLQNSRS